MYTTIIISETTMYSKMSYPNKFRSLISFRYFVKMIKFKNCKTFPNQPYSIIVR